MYLLGERSTELEPGHPGLELKDRARELYRELTERSPMEIDATDDLKAANWPYKLASRDFPLSGGISYNELRRFLLGRATSARRKSRAHFLDYFALEELQRAELGLDFQGFSREPLSWTEGSHWSLLDWELTELFGKGVRRIKVKLWRAKAPGRRRVAIRGDLVLKHSHSTSAGFALSFVYKGQPRAEQLALFGKFEGILEDQEARSDLAYSYERLPRASLLAEPTIRGFLMVLQSLDGDLVQAITAAQLEPFIGGKQPHSRLVILGNRDLKPSQSSGSAVSFDLSRCDSCGQPVSIGRLVLEHQNRFEDGGQSISAKEIDPSTLNELLSADHGLRDCSLS